MWAKRVDVPSISESPDSPKSKPPVDTTAAEAGSKFKAPDKKEPSDIYKKIELNLDKTNSPDALRNTSKQIVERFPIFGSDLIEYLSNRSVKEIQNGNFALAKELMSIWKEIELIMFNLGLDK